MPAKVNGVAKWIGISLAIVLPLAGWVYQLGVSGQVLKANTSNISLNKEEIKIASTDRQSLHLVDERRDEQFRNLCEKMDDLKKSVDAMSGQMLSLQSLMRGQDVQQGVLTVKVDMMEQQIKEGFAAIRTQVIEALKP